MVFYLNSDYPYTGTGEPIYKTIDPSKNYRVSSMEYQQGNFIYTKSDIYDALRRGPLIYESYMALPANYVDGIIIPNRPDRFCDPRDKVNSNVLVGYQVDSEGTEYWLVRSALGPNWGKKETLR